MKAQLACSVLLSVVGVGVDTALAVPTLLADTGRTVSSVQYLVHALDSSESDAETPLVSFPVACSGMSPGKLESTLHRIDIPNWLTRPIFIVGSDAASAKWLAENHALLLHRGAAGIVVSVNDVAAFKSMRRKTSLPLVPHPAPHLIRVLQENGIVHYPLLLLENGEIFQDLGSLRPVDLAAGSEP